MDQLNDYADERLISSCIYCGGVPDTRDHIPSRLLLEKPYPENLPVVGCCLTCNNGFSMDEQYLVCLIEAAIAGSTDPEKIRRPSVARALRRAPALRSRIDQSRTMVDNRIAFVPDHYRIKNVMLKLARGHAAFELSQPCREEPNHFWCGPLKVLDEGVREAFESPHEQQMFGEIGSRGLQRLQVLEASLTSASGEVSQSVILLNDWVDVQKGYYRYLAIDDIGGIVIRIIVADYFACEVAWSDSPVDNNNTTPGQAQGFE